MCFFFLCPSNRIGKKKVADIPGRAHQDITVDDDDDPNFDPTAPVLEDESPYPEVRSAVANTDDPTMPSSTIRAWVVGLIWTVLISGVNQFFYFRYPNIAIDQVCETVSPCHFSLPFGVPVAESNPAIQGFPHGVESPNLQGLGSLPAQYFLLRYPA
jgi:OPT oligopeptide transporter protein